jgi:uncharacterized membrane protein YbhN (UPF0104 family)
MNAKRLVFALKLLILAAILGFAGHEVYKQWDKLRHSAQEVNLAAAPLAVLGFAGVMLTSGLVWYWLARRLDGAGRGGGGPHPLVGLLGAYTYSQMGKYVPGKVVLLVMRIERAGRFGLSVQTCTLSTLLENALYMISGGLAGILGLLWHARDLQAQSYGWVLPGSVGAILVLLACCHPAVFYGFVNTLLKRMKKPVIAPEARLGMGTLALAVLMFLPCWICGGAALWVSTHCVFANVPLAAMPVLMGGFALSVILGMLSLLPGGLGVREAVLALFVVWEIHDVAGPKAEAIAAVAVVLQRLFQIGAEALLGLAGMAVSGGRRIGAQPAASET